MPLRRILLLLALLIFPGWIIRLRKKIFDEKLKKYIILMGGLFVIWLLARVLRIYKPLRFFWYCYYIGMLFIPTVYYLCSNYVTGKEKSIRSINSIVFSTVLLFLVLTNDYHELVFKFINDDYIHNFGYYIVAIWIFLLLIVATIRIVIYNLKKNKGKKSWLILAPIIMSLIYTILYVTNIPWFIRDCDMTICFGIIFFITMEMILKFGLIPNNIEYDRIFRNSFLHICILSKKGKLIYNTKYQMDIPKEILEDIRNDSVKEIYRSKFEDGLVYEVNCFDNCYSIIEDDYSNIENLKKELKKINNKLKEQEKILKKEKNIKDQIYENKINKEILQKLESKLDSKKNKIENILNNMESEDRESLEKVKFLLSYCKRISNLIISNYNEEIYNTERQQLILNELLEDSNVFKVTGFINFKNRFELSSIDFSDMYEVIFKILYSIKDAGVLINIDKDSMKVLIDKKIDSIKEYIEKSKIQKQIIVDEKIDEDETLISINVI